MSQAPLPRPRCPAIASPPTGTGTRKVTAGTMAAVTATATRDGRCVCSYPAPCPAVLIQLWGPTSVALRVRVRLCSPNVTWFYIQFLRVNTSPHLKKDKLFNVLGLTLTLLVRNELQSIHMLALYVCTHKHTHTHLATHSVKSPRSSFNRELCIII